MIDLTDLNCATASPSLMDWAALQEPALGGVTQRIARLGSRYAIDFTSPPLRIEPEGRRWIALLQQAQRSGARLAFPQVEFVVGTPGSPTVDGAHTGGTTLSIAGATPNYAIKQGQALNLTVAGRAYLYFAAATAVLDDAGAGDVMLTTPMRTHLAGGEAVELAKPVIEGWLDGTMREWPLAESRTVSLSFTVTERA